MLKSFSTCIGSIALSLSKFNGAETFLLLLLINWSYAKLVWDTAVVKMFLKFMNCFLNPFIGLCIFTLAFLVFFFSFAFAFTFFQVICYVYKAKKAPISFNNMVMVITFIFAAPNEKQYYKIAFNNFPKVEYNQIDTKWSLKKIIH